jgi:hypothetical protein
VLSDVAGETALLVAVGFILFVENGFIDCLECHTFGDAEIDTEPSLRRLYYLTHFNASPSLVETPERDMHRLLADLARKP